ncbi:MAG: indolepyruvate oxidoreductase subunit beta family protein [Rhodospirillales bacterium]|jgi:indolepyruvate ferredoxin oxidoreductase beta subunit|nr:indolepyruvate oxidoreductase subunit B [Rhodospirillaceae bacterium]MDP6109551.1 indolepyruvate oxidoreductase subunit beta family protein [Rhodospirillales bacterium]
MSEHNRPIRILVSALGGEGGAVLTDWIVNAARIKGLPVQSTSVPGVAQRTGATTYYIELLPSPDNGQNGSEPIMALNPAVGDVDLMVASDISEAGRAIHAGYVSPDRTTVIASTNRIYSITEKVKMDDGRFSSEELIDAIRDRSYKAYLFDYRLAAEGINASLNALLLGLVARSKQLPIEVEHFEGAIRKQDLAVDANLRGFGEGLTEIEKTSVKQPHVARPASGATGSVEQRVANEFPAKLTTDILEAVRRLTDFQDDRYAQLYLDRLSKVLAIDSADQGFRLTVAATRYLAARMSFEDIIRVAQLKIKPERYHRILDEAQVEDGQLVRVTEYFKPSLKEISAIVPVGLGRWLLGMRKEKSGEAKSGLKVRTTTITGFLQLWFLASLRRWRRSFLGYKEVQAAIEEWLNMIDQAKEQPELAFEIVQCAQLYKGYGDTYERSQRNFTIIQNEIIKPALKDKIDPVVAVDAIANARVAALTDATGGELKKTLAAIDQKLKVA